MLETALISLVLNQVNAKNWFLSVATRTVKIFPFFPLSHLLNRCSETVSLYEKCVGLVNIMTETYSEESQRISATINVCHPIHSCYRHRQSYHKTHSTRIYFLLSTHSLYHKRLITCLHESTSVLQVKVEFGLLLLLCPVNNLPLSTYDKHHNIVRVFPNFLLSLCLEKWNLFRSCLRWWLIYSLRFSI